MIMIRPVYIPVITKLIDKRYRFKLRIINKGYRQLKNENKLDLPMQLRVVLSRVKLNDSSLPKGLLRQDDFDIELSVRQYLTERILGLSLNKSILLSLGSNKPLKHPLPKEWRSALLSQGVDVDNFISALLWRMYGFMFFGRGILRGLQGVYLLLLNRSHFGKHIYLNDIGENCLSGDSGRHNIANWYLQWKNKAVAIDSICHSVGSKPNFKLGKVDVVRTDGLPWLRGIKLFQYCGFFIYASIYSLLSLFFVPSYGLFFEEVMKCKRVDLASDNDLASDYLFHNSNPFYRPLWTYLVEKKGARVLLYFYSTNNEEFKTKYGYLLQSPWHLISWPHYLVWDEFQADCIKRLDRHNSIIEVAGPIWFSSHETSIDIPVESIAVFDVTPARPTRYITLGASLEYYIYNTSSQFLGDIQSTLDNNNINMLHKMKRINRFAHKKYIRRVRRLSEKYNFIGVHPNVDALQIIQKTKACISMPFTSTALTAKIEGKPSVYYDPSGMIQKDDRAAHGIPILTSIDELQGWVKSLHG